MFKPRLGRQMVAGVLTLSFVASTAFSAETVTKHTAVRPASRTDVKLGNGGRLVGVVVDRQGKPVVRAKVIVYHKDNVIASTFADEKGAFSIVRLRSGSHRIVTANTARDVRLWLDGTAPPTADARIVLAEEDQIVRAQDGELLGLSPGELGVAAAAIAGATVGIVELSNDDSPSSP